MTNLELLVDKLRLTALAYRSDKNLVEVAEDCALAAQMLENSAIEADDQRRVIKMERERATRLIADIETLNSKLACAVQEVARLGSP